MTLHRMKHDHGFTLVELMVTVGLLALLGAIVGTSFDTQSWFAHHRIRAANRELAFSMQTAKMEALKRNSFCTVTFNQVLSDGITYDYVLFVDNDADLEYDPPASPFPGEEVIRSIRLDQYQGVVFDTSQGGGDGLTFANNDDGLPAMAFDQKGLPRANAGFGAGTAFLTDGSGNRVSIVIAASGRIRTQ